MPAPISPSGIVGPQRRVSGLSSDPGSRARSPSAEASTSIRRSTSAARSTSFRRRCTRTVALKFSNIELTTFNPYSGKFAGYAISKGKLSTAMKYRVEERKLDAQHHIVVDNLEFGDKTDSEGRRRRSRSSSAWRCSRTAAA
jgi:hypothetical protein